MRAAGFRTSGVGKWHLGLGSGEATDWEAPLRPGPLDHGFDAYWGIPASLDMAPYVYISGDALVEPATEEIDASAHRRAGGGGFWRAGRIAPDFRHADVLPRSGERAVAALERAHADGERLFLYVPLSAPHTPWLPAEESRGASGAGYYGDFVTDVDRVVGDVLEALDRLGIAGETLVVATSDNGAHWPDADIERHGHDANLGYRGQKADIYEGGHRVPFLVRWPGRVPAGAVREDLLVLTDLTATLAALCGATVPEGAAEDSLDLSPVFLGAEPDAPVRTAAIHHSLNGTFAVRSGPWKLIEGLGSGGFTKPARAEPAEGEPPGQLYHLGRDPGETTNLWLAEPEVVEELQEQLERARSR